MRDVAFADREWSIALLRYFNPFGAHESGRIERIQMEFQIT